MGAIKFILAVWVLGWASAGPFDDEELIWECGRRTGNSEDVIARLNETRNILVFAADEKVYCYFKCMYEETKWMSPEGKLQVGIFDDENEKEAFEHIVTECMSIMGENPCETAYQFQRCMYTKEQPKEELEQEQPKEQQEQGQKYGGQQAQGQGQEQQNQNQEQGQGAQNEG